MPPRSYRSPPIEEALCEFRFGSGADWDLTVPGKLASDKRIADLYNGKPSQQNVLSTNIALPGLGQPGGPSVAVNHGLGRFQLPTRDGTRLLGIGPGTISFHTLRPYDGWLNFRRRIESGLAAYREIAEPPEIVRVGVRYINRIALPDAALPLSECFVGAPSRVAGLPEKLDGFIQRDEYLYDDGIKLVKTFASIAAEAPPSSFLLDLDLIWTGSPTTAVDDAMLLADVLHSREGVAFEALISDVLRRSFDQ